MLKSSLFRISISFTWVLFVLAHVFFKKTDLYWYYLWLDIPMHLIGGFLVVTTWFFIVQNGRGEKIFSQKFFHPLSILVIMMIGWEVYKYLIGDIISENYLADTVLDLVMGAVGGLIAFKWLSSRTIKEPVNL